MTQRAVATATKAEEPAQPSSAGLRKPPVIPSANWWWEGALLGDPTKGGDGRGLMFVRCPNGLVIQDFHDHADKIWANALRNSHTKHTLPRGPRRLDEVTAIAFDERWFIRRVAIADADHQHVDLVIRPQDITRLPVRAGEFDDGQITVSWVGNGYAWFEKASRGWSIGVFDTVKQAEMDYYRLRPTKV